MKHLTKKNILATVATILFTGLIFNTISELTPSQVIGVDQATLIENETEVVNVNSGEIKELILEDAITTTAKDAVHTQKVNKVRVYLENRNSPLAEYAEDIVKASETYGIDYRLVAAISIIESSGGLHTFKSYNAWGWGKMSFSNWKEAIWTVSKGLGNYYARGLNTPKKIAPVYCPPNATNWGNNVQHVMNEIEE